MLFWSILQLLGLVEVPSLQLAPGLLRLPWLRHTHLCGGLVLQRPAARGRILRQGAARCAGCPGPAAGAGIGVVGALQEFDDFLGKAKK